MTEATAEINESVSTLKGKTRAYTAKLRLEVFRTHSQERMRKKKSACFVRNDGAGSGRMRKGLLRSK